ncbi:uncharacterized protein LOC124266950 [Haliotis rubra]|uniref:uncharacterized protein LOC124266950 n=1 Tax=Haliotis rubra TaxID=36100 RepID=UPI001EE5F8B1|nr:uncharacterized protein LOC124266950 [Haliotis rubra]
MAGNSKCIDSMLKPELRSFLMARGMTVSNYTLAQLRELANKAVELGLPVLTTPDDTASFLLERCTVVVDNETVTFPVVVSPKLKSWTDNLSSLPMFCQADILVYLLGHASWSKERLKGFRKEKGYRLHVDGHVHTVELHSLTHDHIYVRAQCTRETSQSEKAYLTWCLLEKEMLVLCQQDVNVQVMMVLVSTLLPYCSA